MASNRQTNASYLVGLPIDISKTQSSLCSVRACSSHIVSPQARIQLTSPTIQQLVASRMKVVLKKGITSNPSTAAAAQSIPSHAAPFASENPQFIKQFFLESSERMSEIVSEQRRAHSSEREAINTHKPIIQEQQAAKINTQQPIPTPAFYDVQKMMAATFTTPIMPTIPKNFQTKTPSFDAAKLVESLSELKPVQLVSQKKKKSSTSVLTATTAPLTAAAAADNTVVESEAIALIKKHALDGQKALVTLDYRTALIQLKRSEIIMNAVAASKESNKIESDILLFIKSNLGICYYKIGLLAEAYSYFCVCLANIKNSKATGLLSSSKNSSNNSSQTGGQALKKRSFSQLPSAITSTQSLSATATGRTTPNQTDYLQQLAQKLKLKRLKGDLLLQTCIVLSEQGNHEDALIVGKKASKLHLNYIIDSLVVCYHLLLQSVKESTQEAKNGSKALTTRRGYSANSKGSIIGASNSQTTAYKVFEGDFVQELHSPQSPAATNSNNSSFPNASVKEKINYLEKVVPIFKEIMKRTVDLHPCFVKQSKTRLLEMLERIINLGENGSRSNLAQSAPVVNLYERSDLEFLFASVFSRNHWLLQTNILSLLQLKSVSLENTQIARAQIDNEVNIDSILNKISHLCVSFYCISTETRFIGDQKKNQQKLQASEQQSQHAAKYAKVLANLNYAVSESENWLSRSLEIAYVFLPHDMPLVGQIVSVHNKFHNVNKIVIQETDDELLLSDRSRDTEKEANGEGAEYGSPLVTLSGGSKSNFFIPFVRKIKPAFLELTLTQSSAYSRTEEEVARLYRIYPSSSSNKGNTDAPAKFEPNSNQLKQEKEQSADQQIAVAQSVKQQREDPTAIIGSSTGRAQRERQTPASHQQGPQQLNTKRESSQATGKEQMQSQHQQQLGNATQKQQNPAGPVLEKARKSAPNPEKPSSKTLQFVFDQQQQAQTPLQKLSKTVEIVTNEIDFSSKQPSLAQTARSTTNNNKQSMHFTQQQISTTPPPPHQATTSTQMPFTVIPSAAAQVPQQQHLHQLLTNAAGLHRNSSAERNQSQERKTKQTLQQQQQKTTQQHNSSGLPLNSSLVSDGQGVVSQQQPQKSKKRVMSLMDTTNTSSDFVFSPISIMFPSTTAATSSTSPGASQSFNFPLSPQFFPVQSTSTPSSQQQSKLKKLLQKPLSSERKHRTIDSTVHSSSSFSTSSHFINNVSQLLSEMNFPLSAKNSHNPLNSTTSNKLNAQDIKPKSSQGVPPTNRPPSISKQSQSIKPSSAKPAKNSTGGGGGVFHLNLSSDNPMKNATATSTTPKIMKNNFLQDQILNEIFDVNNTSKTNTNAIPSSHQRSGSMYVSTSAQMNSQPINPQNHVQQQLINSLTASNNKAKSNSNSQLNGSAIMKRPQSKENVARSNSSKASTATRKNKMTHLDIDVNAPSAFIGGGSFAQIGSKTTRNPSNSTSFLQENYLNLLKGSQSTKATSDNNNVSFSSGDSNRNHFLAQKYQLTATGPTNKNQITSSSTPYQSQAVTARQTSTPKQLSSQGQTGVQYFQSANGATNDKKIQMLRKLRSTTSKVPDDLLNRQ